VVLALLGKGITVVKRLTTNGTVAVAVVLVLLEALVVRVAMVLPLQYQVRL
jgi:hypothetical protein